jgi:hypothetical protein
MLLLTRLLRQNFGEDIGGISIEEDLEETIESR